MYLYIPATLSHAPALRIKRCLEYVDVVKKLRCNELGEHPQSLTVRAPSSAEQSSLSYQSLTKSMTGLAQSQAASIEFLIL